MLPVAIIVFSETFSQRYYYLKNLKSINLKVLLHIVIDTISSVIVIAEDLLSIILVGFTLTQFLA